MELFIDEAGSFVTKRAKSNSWCVTGLYAYPDSRKQRYKKVLKKLKSRLKIDFDSEIKINKVPEIIYIKFLTELHHIQGTFFCTATDSSLNTEIVVKEHKDKTCKSLVSNILKMKHQSGKDATLLLSTQFEELANQLYIQLHCQAYLINSFVDRGISYYVQRNPNSLSDFQWRIDRKEPKKKLDFEDAFEKFTPPLLQSLSLKEPALSIKDCNYESMEDFIYNENEIPKYLTNKFPYLRQESGFDIQKIVRKDIQFIDSKSSEGIQVVDLLSSGMRKLLRQEFDNNELIAKCFGRLMVQEKNELPPIKLITFSEDKTIDKDLSYIINLLTIYSLPFIYR